MEREVVTKEAKDFIKGKFGVDIEIEFVKDVDAPKRKAEIFKKYEKNEFPCGNGCFTAAANGFPPLMLVSYNNNHLGWVDIFYHELQHAYDYFEIMNALGELPKNFRVYTEYSAAGTGERYFQMAELGLSPTKKQIQDFSDFYKSGMVKTFRERQKTIIDVVVFLARCAEFTKIEGKWDAELLNEIPHRDALLDLGNFMNRYAPTKEWFAEFNKKIDKIPVKII